MKLNQILNKKSNPNMKSIMAPLKKMNYMHFLLIIVIILYTRPRYIPYLPTLPFLYNNSEADDVLRETETRTIMDEKFFKLTDPSVTYAFIDDVEEDRETLEKLIKQPNVRWPILICKYLINRPRPYQINKDITPLHSDTGNTPALPAGHAFQAYYLAHILSKKYPEKKVLLDNIAKRCDIVRVKGGIHYHSDGALSKKIVDFLIKLRIL